MVVHANQYLFQKRGIFYFHRRVPKDLMHHYDRSKIVFSLRTKSIRAAKVKAASLASQLNEDWLTLRWRSKDTPLRRFLRDQAAEARIVSSAPLMTEAGSLYLSAKASNRPETFRAAVDRAVKNLIDLVGDKPIDTYERTDANLLRDSFFERDLSRGTVSRVFSTIRAIINFTTRELGLADVTTFSGVYLGYDKNGSGSNRPTIPLTSISSVQDHCYSANDEARWLIALISDSGMRLSEAAGIHEDDLVLDHEYPHLILRPHPWRRLKTKASERLIPLVGYSLWAVQQASQHSTTNFLFPRYSNETECKANSASAALNKWLKPKVPKGCVIHSFRHSFRDRLRAVECPSEIVDRLGGWSVGGVGESYGSGYPIDVLHKWMERAVSS